MYSALRQLLIIFCLSISAFCTLAQEYFIVDHIEYVGNKKTVRGVINNELDFSSGDTIFLRDLQEFSLKNEKRLLSTGLFVLAKLNVKNWRLSENKADIEITVRENWYIFPSFVFELADRNFNVWWTEQNRDFSRVNYGLSLDHINLTGHRDKLKVKLQRGFTHKYEMNYHFPNISKHWGANGEIFYATNKEIGYQTIDNKVVFQRADDERILLKRFRVGIGVNYRPDVNTFHEFRVEYHRKRISELVAESYNPAYFLNGNHQLRYVQLSYHFNFDKRIFTLYPQGGYAVTAAIKQEGIRNQNINNLSVSVGYEKYHSLSDKWIIGGSIKAKKNVLNNTVAYSYNRALGYEEDYIRGYELYVIDGTDWVLAKSSLSWNIYDKMHDISRMMIISQLKLMPVKLFLRTYFETGYVNETTYKASNDLSNRALYGYGIAFDAILWNTALLSLEYSFNHTFESGIYITSKFSF